ncbi:hypothetical protein [Piscinibacter koreensis]|uniref:Uncharacterized protein n=1 Tax=Piscinibacter koreensis TaxID=2742824 RepID=A0A7Y6TX73_9BURK|nr:hypothetical protein [Schlegelella koreensis]NUZ06741.1 hypothetical protein [Schlegelella koreensis]
MFDLIGQQVLREREAQRVAADFATMAGMLAALYADPEQPQLELATFIPGLQDLAEALVTAHEAGRVDSARAIAAEIERVTGRYHEAPPAVIFGSRAGLWRLH